MASETSLNVPFIWHSGIFVGLEDEAFNDEGQANQSNDYNGQHG